MAESKRIFELTYIECISGLSSRKEHDPFVSIRILTDAGHTVIGQMDIKTARRVGLQFLEAAEASISDAAVFAVVTEELGLPENAAVGLVGALREHRADKDDSDDEPGQ